MKRVVFAVLLIAGMGIAMSSFAQVMDSPPRDGAWDKIHSNNRKMVPYTPVREADVSWSSRVWRVIDFREKMNQTFYYPDEAIRDRVSFMQMVMNALKEGTITAYDAINDEFTKPLSYEELLAKFERVDTTEVEDPDNLGSYIQKITKTTIEPSEIKLLRLKEDWFFDRQRSQLDVRILGICPLKEEKDEEGNIKPGKLPMFWIYFPEARPVFAKTELYNPRNDSERRTFDDIFWKRYFASYIIKQSNTYDRFIASYKTGLDALLEADKIKENIFTLEHDLWEF